MRLQLYCMYAWVSERNLYLQLQSDRQRRIGVADFTSLADLPCCTQRGVQTCMHATRLQILKACILQRELGVLEWFWWFRIFCL